MLEETWTLGQHWPLPTPPDKPAELSCRWGKTNLFLANPVYMDFCEMQPSAFVTDSGANTFPRACQLHGPRIFVCRARY